MAGIPALYSEDINEEVDSIMRKHHVSDPLAGNQIIQSLGISVKQGVLNKIEERVQEENDWYDKLNRKQEVAGREWVDEVKALANSMTDKHSEVDSLANSSCFNALQNDINSIELQQFIDKDNEAKEQEKLLKQIQPDAVKQPKTEKGTKKYKWKYVNEEKHKILYGEVGKPDTDIEVEFRKLKAKINLKVVKQYQEDVKLQKEQEEKAKEVPIEIKDHLGRVVEKVFPKMRSKKIPNDPRRPIVRPPLVKRASFTDQYKNDYSAVLPHRPSKKEITVVDEQAMEMMKKWSKFPIQECLLGREGKKRYKLKIDSIMRTVYSEEYVAEWARYK